MNNISEPANYFSLGTVLVLVILVISRILTLQLLQYKFFKRLSVITILVVVLLLFRTIHIFSGSLITSCL